LDDIPDLGSGHAREMVALDDALNALAEFDPRKARVIELRFFGGLSVEETAEVLKVSPDTVMRDWRLARVWLLAELSRRGLTAVFWTASLPPDNQSELGGELSASDCARWQIGIEKRVSLRMRIWWDSQTLPQDKMPTLQAVAASL
jgi:hypothetical protein